MTTNGTHKVTDPESLGRADESAGFLISQSVDERLEAMLRTIRTWDWRSAVVEAGPPPVDVVATTVPPPTATTSAETHEDSESVVRDHSPFQDVVDTQPVVEERLPGADTRDAPTDGVAPISKAIAAPVESDSPAVEDDPFAEASHYAEALIYDDSESPVRDPAPIQNAIDTLPVVGEPMPGADTREVPTDGVGPITHATAAPVESDYSPPVEVDPFAEAFRDQDSGSPVRNPAPFQDVVDAQPVVEEPVPGPVWGDPPIDAVVPTADAAAAPVEGASPPVEVDPFAERIIEETGADLTSWFGQQPEQEPEPEHEGLVRRVWSHRTTKLAVFAVAAVVVVILILGGIRLFAKSPTSAGTTATTVTRPASGSRRNHVVSPLNAAQMAQYQKYAAGLQSANVSATRGFIQAGSTPTPSQVVLVVGAYRTAVNLYNYQLYFLHWPASMQTAIVADHAQLQALASLLQAFPSVAPNGVPAWLSQLHNRASTAEAADNVVREALGLPASSSFP
jgi:hypothetical protein